jgi:chorismate synthase
MIGGVPETPVEASWDQIVSIPDDSLLRCVDKEAERRMVELIDAVKNAKDTLGGIFEVAARGVCPGLGSHIQWNSKIDGRLAQALMCIPAVKAVEIGSGVEVSRARGSQIHDEIGYNQTERKFTRPSNRAGGIEGGITNGEEIRVRGHLKPISTLRRPLASVDVVSKQESVASFERSDIVAVPAAGVIGEAMVSLVLADAAREKFGGDTLEEMKRNYKGYIEQLARY